MKKLLETVADLAYLAGAAGYYSGDSRRDTDNIIGWAKEFEALNKGREWDGEYMEEIESFFKTKIS